MTASAPPAGGRGHAALALLLVAIWLALTALAAQRVGRTADEGNYANAGRVILVERGWNHGFTRAQGPIPFYFAQTFLGGHELDAISQQELALARWGMLPLGLLLAGVVYGWARRAHGPRGGLFALLLFALHPLTIGYGSLVTVDLAFSAFVALAAWILWEYARRPRALLAAASGAALACACATKYAGLLYAPLALGLLALFALRARAPVALRAVLASGHALAFGAAFLLALHASYLFWSGFAPLDPAAYSAERVRALVALPGIGHALALLPEAFLRGVDFQMQWAQGDWKPFLNGRFALGHPSYYAWAVLLKTPEVVLLLGAAWLALAARAAMSRERAADLAQRSGVELVAVAGVFIALPFLYFSLLTKAQVGIRYVLPSYPLVFVLLGALAQHATVRRLSPPLRTAALLALVAALGIEVARAWPNEIAYYNRLFGGQARAYRHFVDTNSDWNQLRDDGPERLHERGLRDFDVLLRSQGPRFGRTAAYVADLARRDPEDPTRSRHWLDPFEPIEHLDAAWYVFDVDRESFERAAERGDERVRVDLATALLAVDETEAAERALSTVSAERAEPLRAHIERLRHLASHPDDRGARAEAARVWTALGRPDRTAELLGPLTATLTPAEVDLLASAYYQDERWDDVVALLAPRTDLAEHPALLMLLADAHRRRGESDDSIRVLETELERIDPLVRPMIRARLEVLLRRRDGLALIRESLRAPFR